MQNDSKNAGRGQVQAICGNHTNRWTILGELETGVGRAVRRPSHRVESLQGLLNKVGLGGLCNASTFGTKLEVLANRKGKEMERRDLE
jgi:hypothetical protein